MEKKIKKLEQLEVIQKALQAFPFLEKLSLSEKSAVYSLFAIGQGFRVFAPPLQEEGLRKIVKRLVAIDTFYAEIGGLIGYQAEILRLLRPKSEEPSEGYFQPELVDITEETESVTEVIALGLDFLPYVAEMYAVGGAADRLHLVDGSTGEELPAAKLPFAGRTLFCRLIEDLQAREYLYYRLYGEQICVPVAMMTSEEKENHRHIVEICEANDWFGRTQEGFRFFTQPLVPVVDEEGNWCIKGPLDLLLKPGGHGAIWKLALERGIFSWFKARGRRKILIRQINNPIAGLDYGLLAFMGWGWSHDSWFGFASCPRKKEAAEGMNVIIERGASYALSNIEYCERRNIADPAAFPANTNILFADIERMERAARECPMPGALINIKPLTFRNAMGEEMTIRGGRLETIMQNIAGVLTEKGRPLQHAYVTHNHRHKTISTAKKVYQPGGSSLETPERCFYELMQAHRELLTLCRINLPPEQVLEEFLERPSFAFLYHPALGPLYAILREKLQGGAIACGSALNLQISELFCENLTLSGSLSIQATAIMGKQEGGVLRYSDQEIGKCRLRNIQVINQGIDWEASRPIWKADWRRRESCRIVLHGNAKLTAENVVLRGDQEIIVEDGSHLFLSKKERRVEKVETGRLWDYLRDEDGKIRAALCRP